MNISKRPIFWVTVIAVGAACVAIILTGCSPSPGPVEQIKSPTQIWIEAHPTYTGDAGECIEWDGEPCDEDPFDTDDMTEWDKHNMSASPKVTPRPMKTGLQPAPTPAAKKTSAPAAPKPKPKTTRR